MKAGKFAFHALYEEKHVVSVRSFEFKSIGILCNYTGQVSQLFPQEMLKEKINFPRILWRKYVSSARRISNLRHV